MAGDDRAQEEGQGTHSGRRGRRMRGLAEPPRVKRSKSVWGKDPSALKLLFDWSMAEFLEHYLEDRKLISAYLGQGVIGTNASPFDRGTASIHLGQDSGPAGWGAGASGDMWWAEWAWCRFTFAIGLRSWERGSRRGCESPRSTQGMGLSSKGEIGSLHPSSSRMPILGRL